MSESEIRKRLDGNARTSRQSEEELRFHDVHGIAGRGDLEPERRLIAAVLEMALEDLNKKKLRPGAVKWMLSERSGSLFDFVPVCEALGLDPEAVRGAVRRGEEKRALTSISWPR